MTRLGECTCWVLCGVLGASCGGRSELSTGLGRHGGAWVGGDAGGVAKWVGGATLVAGNGSEATTGGSPGGAAGARGWATGGSASGGGTAGGSAPSCPGTGGPSMIRVPEGYCIDSTEVTRAQYAAWLDGNPSMAEQISDCTWNTTFAPDASCITWACQTGCDHHPQVCVDWCDAYAYCRAVGKRLCGKIGGGSNGRSDYANASLSQWYNACVSHDPTVNLYPYGPSYDAEACNGWAYSGTQDMTTEVGTLANCQSRVPGYSGVYDLSGNVEEWEDSCTGTGPEGRCRIRGGAFIELGMYLFCDADFDYVRSAGSARFGIRCCSSP